MESQTIDEGREVLPQDYLRMPRGEKAKFRISCCLYFAAIIALFVLTLEGLALHGYSLKTGLVIGSLFPIMTLLYYYRHYLGNPKSVNRTRPWRSSTRISRMRDQGVMVAPVRRS